MSGSSETILLIVAVILILAGVAGTTIKAFNIEVPAITSKYARICLFTLGVILASAALWVILRPTLDPQRVSPAIVPTIAPRTAPEVETPADSTSPPEAPSGSQATDVPPTGPPATGRISLNQTVTGTLFFNEGNSWVFSEGPATVNVILDVSHFGEALIVLFDSQGIQREYVDAQNGREERLINYYVPDNGDHTIFVRNSLNSRVDYRLTLEHVDR
jgi:hypothetical protein